MKIDDTCVSGDSNITSCDTGLRLKLLRELAGFSQRELAKRAKLTNSSISTIEQGRVSPSIQSLARILAAIPISLGDFFSLQLPFSPSPKSGATNSDVLFATAKTQTLKIPSHAAQTFMVAKGDISGAVLKGELGLSLDSQRLRLTQGETFYVAQGQLFRCANTTDLELHIFVCSPVDLNF